MNNQVLIVCSLNSISPGNYLIEAFERKGFDVIVISDVFHPKAKMVKFGSVDIANFVNKNQLKPKFLLYVEGGEMGVFPINLGNLEFPTYWWGIDTHNDYKKHYYTCKLFDHSFIAQKQYVKKLALSGIQSVSWLPLAFPIRNIPTTNREIDFAYIGSLDWNLYPERLDLLDELKKLSNNFYIGSCLPDEMFSIYSNSKIVFNHSLKNDVNMRIFEAIGSGSLLVTNEIIDNGFEDLFDSKQDLVIYKNSNELVAAVAKLLSNTQLCSKIANRAKKKVLSSHTYDNRVESILSLTLGEKKVYDMNYEVLTLMRMGLYSDCLETFWEILVRSANGRRNKFLIKFIRPFVKFVIILSEIIEIFAIKTRLKKW